jgi:hypothetical protein
MTERQGTSSHSVMPSSKPLKLSIRSCESTRSLTAAIFNFIADALFRLPDVRWEECSESHKVVTTLLSRLRNDLQTIA